MHRRRFLQGALAGSTFAAPMIGPFVSSATAQAWPSRNIAMVVPLPAGVPVMITMPGLSVKLREKK